MWSMPDETKQMEEKENTQRQSQPPVPSITIHHFEAHRENCRVCTNSNWDIDKLLQHCQDSGYVACKKGNKLLAVILDDEGSQVLKRMMVEDTTVTIEILGRQFL